LSADGPKELLPDVGALSWLVAPGLLTRKKGNALAKMEGRASRGRFCESYLLQSACAPWWSVRKRFFGEQRIYCRAQLALKQHPGVIALQREGENWTSKPLS
jgi:hypothetical protein